MTSNTKLLAAFRKKDVSERAEWLCLIFERWSTNDSAIDFLLEIQDIWKTESYVLPLGKDRERPDPGLLRNVGYGVGWRRGQSPEVRRTILEFILIADHLPRQLSP